MHQIDESVTALSRLIDDLLDVSRIESGRFELERAPVELCSLVDGRPVACEETDRVLRSAADWR